MWQILYHIIRLDDRRPAQPWNGALVHEFRRVTLHDPQLPSELLPSDWPETAAYALCRDLYRRTHERAERHLAVMLENSRGAPRLAAPYFYERFGGLRA